MFMSMGLSSITLGIPIAVIIVGIYGSVKVITDGIGGTTTIVLGTFNGPKGPIFIEGKTTGGKLMTTGTGSKFGISIKGKSGIGGHSIGGTVT